MTQYIKKLPAVFQTVTEKKFFDATFDQVFSKKDSSMLSGFLGRRDPGSYNPISDFYLPEPSKNRTWWQLEATAFAQDPDTTKTNIYFYEDLLDRINYYGGNTLNQDRLFESEYYSFGPPIDYDMFINYQNYYWIEQGLATITISGVMASDIINQASYTTPNTATPPGLTLSTGMTIVLTDDPSYIQPHVVENLGGCDGIILIQQFSDFTAGTIFEFLPWDGVLQLSTGRIISNTLWDGATWDIEAQPGNGDYITIERGAIDRNTWSRTNKWFHIDTINTTIAITGTVFPSNATRALRPIIQFVADLVLYKSGTQFRKEITYGFVDDTFGNPLHLSQFQNQPTATLNSTYHITLLNGSIVGFFNDTNSFSSSNFPSESSYDLSHWTTSTMLPINAFLYQVTLNLDGTTTFVPYTSFITPVIEGDIVFIDEDAPADGAIRGSSWYFSNGIWSEVFNDKVSANQAPLFQLYDHNGITLDDPTTYPLSNFEGSPIFSYKINTTPGATVDPVLGFPILYTALGQASDIIFDNDLITQRYTYSTSILPINGYYYYKTLTDATLFNNWNLYDICDCSDIVSPPPCNCLETSKQRVIDKYVVGFGSEFKFALSVEPLGYPASPDIIVSVNGIEVKALADQIDGYTFTKINNTIYVDLTAYLTTLFLTTQSQPPVIETQTYTWALLDPAAPGYFQIPQQLEANPNQLEVGEINGSDLIQQFSSIISNQIGAKGAAFGGPNNYRDTRKNRSLGSYILQNIAPTLKTMLVSSSDDLDFIVGERFSSDEYTKFKSKFLTVALQLINSSFTPVSVFNNTVGIDVWVEEILKTVNISKEFSNAFAYSYMVANGSPFSSETKTTAGNALVTLTDYVDLSDPRNVLYIYDVTNAPSENLLLVDQDYTITSTNLSIEVQLNLGSSPRTLIYYLYKNPVPTYIPSTPSKLGTYGTYLPRIELDTSYAIPTNVIIGHDGSKTIAYGDYRDQLLLGLEKRIYNGIQNKFRQQYQLPLRLQNVLSGFYRQTRYSREEFFTITESYINKWSAKYRANYRVNDWTTQNPVTPVGELWKLYNYRSAVTPVGVKANLPGNWKGIFQYYYDTYYPDTRPWEMLGFSEQPDWWVTEYGSPVINIAGQKVWASTAASAHNMYSDLQAGIIRQGPTAVYDPNTGDPIPNSLWERPGLSSVIPVTSSGEIIPIITLFGLAYSGNPYEPFAFFDEDWIYGDGGPVEQAWYSTSAYAYSIQEFLYLMKPGPYGELMFDTLGTEYSPGTFDVGGGIEGPVQSNQNPQYVQNEVYTSTDPFFAWFRPKNADQIVHAEIVDGVTEVRFGYQVWISDRILFLGSNVADTFGQKVRTLDVNLANKFAGFTNQDTTNTYIQSITPGAVTDTLIIPSTNFGVTLHTSPPVDTYNYSGIIVRGLSDGTFVVYGYDLLNAQFTTFDRSNDQAIDVTIGGTPAPFQYFTPGATYNQGDIVRYNGVYYESLVTQLVTTFNPDAFVKLRSLPTIGGISVVYRPLSLTTTTTVPYGSILSSAQEVFDLMIGYGAWLKSVGWQFEDVSQETNQVSDWLYSAKQFLFWLNTNWAPDASIQVSPLADKASLIVARGYPDDVEILTNGVYSILDKNGVAISPQNTTVDREGQFISVSPANVAAGGIYFLQVTASETEHILIFDNTTSFNDIIYSPLLRARQERLNFVGFRTNGWYGKKEAPGYLIIDNQIVPNYDSIVDAMRYFYDPNVIIDNPSLEELGRHLIGYDSKSYLENLEISNNIQYLFYQGAIRQKGTKQALENLFRSTKVQTNEVIEVFEEWALKLGDFGNTVEQVSTEFILLPEQNTGEVIVARLNFIPSKIGFVKEINILNAENTYTIIPQIVITAPDANPDDPALTGSLRQAKAYVVLDSTGAISRVDVSDPGYGYLSAPAISINSGSQPNNLDRLYSVWQGQIIKDTTLDNIINIDIDQTDVWVVRPAEPAYSLEFPVTSDITYPMPNAGYVNFNDVDFSSFDEDSTTVTWGSSTNFNPVEGNTIWVANTYTTDWDVYKLVETPFVDVIPNAAGGLYLRTLATDPIITPQFSTTGNTSDFGNLLVLQVIGAQGTAVIAGPSSQATAIPDFPHAATATASLTGSSVSSITVIDNGGGYVTPPIVSITPIISDNATAISTVSAGGVNSITITNTGSGYATSPIVTVSAPGIQATAVSSITESGTVSGISLTEVGSGYLSAPSVTIAAPVLITATATAVHASPGPITIINVIDNGSGYATAPEVTITGDGTGAKATSTILNGVVIGITVSAGGSGYSTATVTIAAPTGTAAHATSTVVAGQISAITITDPGTGYSTTPNVTIGAPAGVAATASSVLSNGSITSVVILTPGSGYTNPPLITIGAPNGFSATAVANLTGDHVTSISITDAGLGYSSPPTITIPPPIGLEEGTINGITITAGGSGYTDVPNVAITGDGTGAEATAVLTAGVVSSIIVTNPGSGYTTAGVTISAPPAAGIGNIASITLTKTGANYDSVPAVTITGDGTGAAAIATIAGGEVSGFVIITGGFGYTTATITIAPPTVIDPDSNYAVGFVYNSIQTAIDPTHSYYDLVTVDGDPVQATDIPQSADFTILMLFKTMRFMTTPPVPSYVTNNDKIWVDNNGVNLWTVYDYVSVPTPKLTPFRVQEDLINTSLFESATVFNTAGLQLVLLPIYDPFKNILPGPAKQNLSYMTLQDPARYNVTGDLRLFSENIIFGPLQVGRLWWDLSSTRFVYYEQPIALDDSETEIDNLVYRRDHWAQIFPGSVVNVYEWVQSPVPPTQYAGSGTPRDITTYVQIVTSDRFTSATQVNYYFWVLNITDRPNLENRTLAATDVSSLLQSPKSQGFAFFCPIQQTATNNSYMFYNVQEILAYQGDNIQVQYRQAERNDQKHAQWAFFREGDPSSLVTDQFWDKMVDSLCGYTKLLPVTGEFGPAIIIADNLPWDVFGWDISPWDDARGGP